MGIIRFLLSPNGRIGRAKWWLGMIALLFMSLALEAWLQAWLFDYDVFDPAAQPLAKPAIQILSLAALILLVPLFAITAKRLHDRGRGATWSLLVIVPAILWLGAKLMGFLDFSTPDALAASWPWGQAVMGLSLLVTLWAIIDLGILRGTEGENAYGPDPLMREVSA